MDGSETWDDARLEREIREAVEVGTRGFLRESRRRRREKWALTKDDVAGLTRIFGAEAAEALLALTNEAPADEGPP